MEEIIKDYGAEIDPLKDIKDLIGITQAIFGPQMAPLFFEPIICVVDSSYILSDIRRYLRDRKPTVLIDCLSKGLIRAVAPMKLYSEVMDHLRDIDKESDVPLKELGDIWINYYYKHLKFLKVDSEKFEILLKNLRDPEDKEFVQVYESSSADTVLSLDPHLKELGISPHNPIQFLIDVRHYARGQSLSMMMTFAGGAVVLSTYVTAQFAIQALVGLVNIINRKLPWFFPLVFVGMAIALCIPTSRQFIVRSLKKLVSDFNQMTKQGKIFTTDVTHTFLNVYGSSIQRSLEAKRNISSLNPSHHRTRLVDNITRALLESSHPLTILQIQERVIVLGYKPRGIDWNSYLRRILYYNSNFERTNTGQWILSGTRS